MKIFRVLWILLASVAAPAWANEFNVQCAYSHTLPDDPIMYPGLPGQAMGHDFFGNTATNASSTYGSLNDNKLTTCDSTADVSAYWAPQLKRASGIVVPSYQKTYYKNDQPVVPLQAIPAGLEMLAGDHKGTTPNPHINFLCAGGSYTTVAPTQCPLVTGSDGPYAQLDISVHFPDCWDGKTLVPDPMAGIVNMAYRNADGTCPSAFPVKLPELQMNIAYDLGQDPDMSSAQLSLDPVWQDGRWVLQWGGMYTAHGDFIDAWKVDSMQYMIDTCMNAPVTQGSTCSKSIPTYYSVANADAWTDTNGVVHATDATLMSTTGSVVLMKFDTPRDLGAYPYATSSLQTYGQNVSDSTAVMLDLYAASTDWDDATHPPTASACSTQHIGGIYLDNLPGVRTNDVTSYVAAQVAAGATQIGICIRNTTGRSVQFSSREGGWAPALYLK
ncbi:DUF1996 domain-containing protein [Paraburkholderia sp. D15]|uniref:DUF1996 domain-containing protein n=1 Tax=Paraburkholderia sp. D15 TaxID=2880218 RepID=UPI0024795B59|nr:DUF1996 domain-containing protein [Paraburkholderia sp. D15]WGS50544.1 DUF1996 domain-containing protein [Paraburkholderia sp. D15]